MKTILFIPLFLAFLSGAQTSENDTFIPLKNGTAPPSFHELWAGFDPRKEPLDVEILHEWQEENVVMKVLRYRIGIFKGSKAMMAAIYGYPKGAKNLPGLLQIHGGGQYADYRAVLTNANRGYATISIAWAGRINAPGYNVTHATVKLFMENKTNDPGYKITTDWGAVDGYHDPCRNPENSFVIIPTASWTLDPVKSPRNNSWFLCTVGARRALTFLEQQTEVDPGKLGVYGHSMGGKITVLTTGCDPRVKASAPSCGGISDRYNEDELYRKTLGDDVYLKEISCPVIFLSPSNDFHGRIDDLQKAMTEIKSRDFRITCSPHHNHQDTPEYMVTGLLWFDQYLKGTFRFPETPDSKLRLNAKNGVPRFTVIPDASKPVLYVDVFYTQQGQIDGEPDDRENTVNRFWHHAGAQKRGNSWIAELPLFTTGKPLWVYANVGYRLVTPVDGAGYYYKPYSAYRFNLSSRMHMVTPMQLKRAGIKATMAPSLTIEDFNNDWQKEWFTYQPEEWGLSTHKVYCEIWKAPLSAKLTFEVRVEKSNLMVVRIDDYAAEVPLRGGSQWQTVTLTPADFRNIYGKVLTGFQGIRELRLSQAEILRIKRNENIAPVEFGAVWEGPGPEFRNLSWTENGNRQTKTNP